MKQEDPLTSYTNSHTYMMDITPTIEIYFSNNNDSGKAFTIYNVEDNDEQI